ncbi:MAG: GAF domain-containing protein [Planctomycetes bacterium]|nr:GAF domain-containing protein [Planctomycetota bacterium]
MKGTENRPAIDYKKKAAALLRRHKQEALDRWMGKMSLLAREKGEEEQLNDPILMEDARQFSETLIDWLEGMATEADVASFYHLILEGRQYKVRMADLAYLLLELRTVAEEIIFENVSGELEALRISRILGQAIDGVLRKAADFYELSSEADSQVTQERIGEIFSAWDLERLLADVETPVEVCELATKKLAERWNLLGCRWRFYEPGSNTPQEYCEGARLPVPMIKEQRRFLSEEELEREGRIDLMESVRRRLTPYVCETLGEDDALLNGKTLSKLNVESLICQPLVARGSVVGSLLMFSQEAGAFRAARTRRLEDLAGVIALALHRTGHLELSHKRLTESELIARIGRSLLELPTREALLEGVAGALRDFRDYFDVSLLWVDREEGSCVLVAEAGRERSYRPPDYRQPIGEGFIGICADTGATIRATDLERDQRRVIAFPEENRVRTEIAVPVKRGEEVIGVIHFLSDREDDFTQSEIAALEHVAPHIGVALQNAEMIDQRTHDVYEIERAHRQLANIIRSTAVGITGADARGVYTHWSPSCEALLGYKSEEVVGRTRSVDFAQEPYALDELLEQCLRDGRVMRECNWLRKDGTPRIIRETMVPMKEEGGRHIGFTSYLVDVTERRNAQQQLRNERDTLKMLVEAMGAGLALFDGDHRLQWANSTLMKWLNLDETDFGRPCHEIYLCGRTNCADCPAVLAAEAGQPHTRILEITDSSEVWKCYKQVFTPVGFGETQLIVLSFDVTEQRRQTEQAGLISKLTEKVAQSLDLERVLYLVLTCVTAGRAIGFNRAAVFLLDEEESSMRGAMAVGPVSAEDAARIWGALDNNSITIDKLLDSAGPSESDKKLTERIRTVRISMDSEDNVLVNALRTRTSAYVGDAAKPGDSCGELADTLELGEFACVPLAVEDHLIGVMLADNKYSRKTIDRYQVELLEMFSRQASLAIANARAYERIRRQFEELQRTRDRLIEAERMASVGRMAGHMAHEIRNPLTTIGGFAASIARRHREDSITYRNATIIYEEVLRLEQTLISVLDYTRPLRPSKSLVSINDVVRDTLEQFRPQFERAGISVRFTPGEPPPRIMADGKMIKQIAINLVKNAIEAMETEDEGTLSIETVASGDHVELIVEDTGAGLKSEVAENLFSPYFTTKIGGIGLGLSVSQRIAREHGGDIKAESQPGSGTRFTVSLEIGDKNQEGRRTDGKDSSR